MRRSASRSSPSVRRQHRLIRALAQLGADHDFRISRGKKFGGDLDHLDLIWSRAGRPKFEFEVAARGLPTKLAVTASDTLVSRYGPIERCLVIADRSQAVASWRRLEAGEFADWQVLTISNLEHYLGTGRFPEDQRKARQVRQVSAEVVENIRLRGEHCELVLRCPEIASQAWPGQFLHLLCADQKQVLDFERHKNLPLDWNHDLWPDGRQVSDPPLLRRPLSIHRVCHLGFCVELLKGRQMLPWGFRRLVDRSRWDLVELLFRLVGRGTKLLSEKRPGDCIDVLGPLGTGFQIGDHLKHALLIAGGIGVAPLLGLAQELRWRGIEVKALIGVVDEAALPVTPDSTLERIYAGEKVRELSKEFSEIGVETEVVSEKRDRILVTEYLERNWDRLLPAGKGSEIFACGPRAMLGSLARMIGDQIPCQVTLEERMACGLGMCRSCVIKVRSQDGFEYRTTCSDGPVFRASEVIWD